MEALFLATRIAVRKEGKTPSGELYNLLPTGNNDTFILTPEGQVLEFKIQTTPNTFLTYIYIGYEYILDTDKPLLADRRKYKFNQFGGYCLKTVYEQYKNFKLSLEKFLFSDNWFDHNFVYAQISDSITIDKLEFDEPSKYYKQKKYFLIVTSPDMDFFLPQKYTTTVLDRSENLLSESSGRFYQKNIPAINDEPIKKQLYTKTITLIAFRTYNIYKDIFKIISKAGLPAIEEAVFKKYQQSDSTQYNSLFKIDQIIGELLKDWGYIEQVEPTYILKDRSLEYAEAYYNSMSSFYSSLKGADKNVYFGYDAHNNPLDFNKRPITNDEIIQPGGEMGHATQQEKDKADDERRINILLKHLTTAGIGLLDYETRLGFIKNVLNKPSLPKESGDELTQNNVLKVISTFANPNDADPFLNFLLKKNDGKLLNFQNLYYKITEYVIEIEIPILGIPIGNKERSRKVLVYILFTIWNYSRYNPNYIPVGVTPNPEGLNPNSFFLTSPGKYYFEKQNGEPATDKSLEFAAVEIKQDVVFNYYEVDEEFHDERIRIKKSEARISNTQEKFTDLWYHLYQPILILGYKQVESGKKEEFCIPEFPRVPAFMFFYFKELEKKNDTNALINLGVQVTSDLLLMYFTGGASELVEMRYLKYMSESGKIILNPSIYQNATNVVRLWKAINATEGISFTASTLANFASYLSKTSTNETDKEFYDRMRNLALLVMLGTGLGSITAQGKAIKEAEGILSMLNLTNLTVVLTNEAKEFLVSIAKSNDYLNTMIETINALFYAYAQGTVNNIGPVLTGFTKAEQLAFYFDFIQMKDITKWLKLNEKVNGKVEAMINWRNLNEVGTADRTAFDIITNTSKTNIMVRFYNEKPIKTILESSGYIRRWSFLNGFKNIDNDSFALLKSMPESIYVWFDLTLDVQQQIANNSKIWLKYKKVRNDLKLGNYNNVASIFGKNIIDAIAPPGHPDLRYLDLEDDIDNTISIASRTDDVAKICFWYPEIPQEVLQVVKENYYRRNIFFYDGSNFKIGRFGRNSVENQEWLDAIQGYLSNSEKVEFINLIIHEYIESKLMDEGFNFRSYINPENQLYYDTGAHFLSPTGNPQGGVFYPMNFFKEAPPKISLLNLDKIVDYYLIKNKIK